MAKKLNEGHLCLLKDYYTAHKVYQSMVEIDEIVCDLLSEHVKDWVKKHLGDEWDGSYNWSKNSFLTVWKKSWLDKDTDKALAYFWIGVDNADENVFWVGHLLSLAQEPFKVAYCFEQMIDTVGSKNEALKRTRVFADQIKGKYVEVSKKKNDLSFETSFLLDGATLAIALKEEGQDLDLAFQPVTALLEEFKSYFAEIDTIVVEALKCRT